MNSFNPELQLKGTESAIENKLIDLFSELKLIKFVATLVLMFTMVQSNDKILYSTFYLRSRAETITNEGDIGDVFESIYITIISNIQKSLGQGSGWITDSVINHSINISKYLFKNILSEI